jgi:hypothetical protein
MLHDIEVKCSMIENRTDIPTTELEIYPSARRKRWVPYSQALQSVAVVGGIFDKRNVPSKRCWFGLGAPANFALTGADQVQG